MKRSTAVLAGVMVVCAALMAFRLTLPTASAFSPLYQAATLTPRGIVRPELTQTASFTPVTQTATATLTQTPSSTPTPVVSNDYIGDAAVLPAAPFTITGEFYGATRSTSDPVVAGFCDSYNGATIWYQYTPVQDERVEFDALGTDTQEYPLIAVFTGTEGSLMRLGCLRLSNHSNSGVDLNLTAGTIYTIMLARLSALPPTGATPVILNARPVVPPSNDLFEHATVVNSLPFSSTQALYPATKSANDPRPTCRGTFQHTLWFQYTAAADETVRVDLSGSTTEMVAAVYTGAQSSLTEVACGYSGADVRTNFQPQAGVTYSILVAFAENQALSGWADVVLNITASAPPDNDEIDAATEIGTLPFSTIEDVYGATANYSDPQLQRFCLNATSERSQNTVWYQFTPDITQSVQLSTVGSSYPAYVGIYSGSADNLTRVACMESPRLSLILQGGTTYWLMVTAQTGGLPVVAESSALQLSLDAPLASNDLIENAQEISSLPFSLTEDISGASVSPTDVDNCQTNFQTHSVWFRYTPTADGEVAFNTLGSDYPAGMSVFTGAPGQLTLIHCSYAGVGFQAQSGLTYYIKVSRAVTSSYAPPNTFLRFTAQAPTIANDLVNDALVIPAESLPYSAEQNVYGATTTSTDPGSQAHVGNCDSSIVFAADRTNTVWYQFTPNVSGTYLVDAQSSDFQPAIYIYDDLSSTDVGCGFGIASAELEAGTIYWLKFAYIVSNDGVFASDPTMLRFTVKRPAVANDFPRDAQEILTPFDFTEEVSQATVTRGEPAIVGCGPTTNTVWFRYRAPSDTSLIIDTAGSSYDTSITLFNEALNFNRGCGGFGADNSPQAALQLNVAAGDVFYIVVANESNTPLNNPATLHLTVKEAPINDLIENARVIPPGSTVYYNMQDLNRMSQSAADPSINCSVYGARGFGETMWYSYTPDASRTVKLRLGASNTSLLAVFTGTPGALKQVGCDTGAGTAQFIAAVDLPMDVGTTYWIMASVEALRPQAMRDTYLMSLRMTAQDLPPTATPSLTPTATPLPPPQLLAPANNAATTSVRPTFSWSPADNFTQYEIQIDTANPPQNTPILANGTIYTPDAALVATTYYWRVRVVAPIGETADWSETRKLSIYSLPNVAPVLNAASGTQATLTWNAIDGAIGYQIIVAADALFTLPYYDSGVIGADALAFTLPVLPDGVWYWHIRAQRTNGIWSAWSTLQTVVVG